ncbi:MAG: PP2C family serine/threonine-protein phosphatase [Anaerolineaceae bacterium]|jgi:protein phosphatase
MIRTDQAHLPAVALTHAGMTGKTNEDRYAVSAYKLSPHQPPSVLLAVLSDGIGGHRAGEVAAELAVNTISQYIAQSNEKHPIETIRESIELASRTIYAQASHDPEHSGMGSTVALALAIGDHLYTASVGDSRIYLVRDGHIFQLTTDHTWIQEALEKGILKPEQVKGHPNTHVIRRYLGSPTPPVVDFRLRLSHQESDDQALANQGMVLKTDDRLLLCSDGLTDLVKPEEILAVLLSKPLKEAVQALIDLANQRGGHDNITLIAIQVPENLPKVASPSRKRVRAFLGITASVLVILALALGVLWIKQRGIILNFSTPTPVLQIVPSPTLLVGNDTAQPMATVTPLPVITFTPTALPTIPNGPTLTPWPTNTLAPQSTP